MDKIKKVVKYEDLPRDAMDALHKKYPEGWKDFVKKITKPNGDFFYAVSVDTETASYLVKVNVKIDTKTDLEKMHETFTEKETEKEVESEPAEEPDKEEEN